MTVDPTDFYALEMLLTADERALLHSVRDFMTKEVDPIITNHWARATFASRSFPDFAGWASRAFHMRGTGAPAVATCWTGW